MECYGQLVILYIAQTDLLYMCDKKGVVESTLRAMGLDHTRVPTTCNPGYRHTAPSDDETAAKTRDDRMRALMSGDAPPHNWEHTSLHRFQRRSCLSPQVCHRSQPVHLQGTTYSSRQGILDQDSSQQAGQPRCDHGL